jgi:hypothetical protein
VNAGELVCLPSGNASKSTALKTILGIVIQQRSVRFDGGRDASLDQLPDPSGHGDRSREPSGCSRR